MAGCIGLRRADQECLAELRAVGIHATEQGQTIPALAGGLNLLPGIGNFYLGATSEQGPQWAIGFVNLLTWPLSIVWGVPQAAIDANTVNKLATIDHYFHSAHGRLELAQRQRKLETRPEGRTSFR